MLMCDEICAPFTALDTLNRYDGTIGWKPMLDRLTSRPSDYARPHLAERLTLVQSAVPYALKKWSARQLSTLA